MGMHTVLLCDVKGLERLLRTSKRSAGSNVWVHFDGASAKDKAENTRYLISKIGQEIEGIKRRH